jgi:DNA-binding MarR family transcriptional regulator
MKNLITNLSKIFDHRVRLGIMSILLVNDWVDFNTLKEMLDLYDGTLASHIKTLEEAGYLEVRKRFVGRKPNTSYRATAAGREAFNKHLDALEQLIRMREEGLGH